MRRAFDILDSNSYVAYASRRATDLSKIFSLTHNPVDIEGFAAKNRLPKEHIAFIHEMWNILEEIYPDRGDIQFGLRPEFKIHRNTYGSNHIPEITTFSKLVIDYIYIVIYFPEIEIANSKHAGITIKDLYVRIPIERETNDTDKLRLDFQRIEGTRTTVSIPEYIGNYLHSHLGQDTIHEEDNRCKYNKFCTGSGDINASTAMLNHIPIHRVDIDMIKLLLLQIDTYVKWESLEGVPHRRLSDVVTKSATYINIPIQECRRLFNGYVIPMLRNNNFNIDWKFQNGKYHIVDNENLEDMFRMLHNMIPRASFLYKDEKGEYYTPTTVNPISLQSKAWIPFRGEKKFFKVEGDVKKNKYNDKLYINPKIKNYVKTRLEFQANFTKTREAGIIKCNTCIYT